MPLRLLLLQQPCSQAVGTHPQRSSASQHAAGAGDRAHATEVPEQQGAGERGRKEEVAPRHHTRCLVCAPQQPWVRRSHVQRGSEGGRARQPHAQTDINEREEESQHNTNGKEAAGRAHECTAAQGAPAPPSRARGGTRRRGKACGLSVRSRCPRRPGCRTPAHGRTNPAALAPRLSPSPSLQLLPRSTPAHVPPPSAHKHARGQQRVRAEERHRESSSTTTHTTAAAATPLDAAAAPPSQYTRHVLSSVRK